MKVPRGVIGEMVEVRWRDPSSAYFKIHVSPGGKRTAVPFGYEALAYQTDRGRLVALHESPLGVILCVEHSVGTDSALLPDPNEDHHFSWTPESLVESLTVFVPSKVLPEIKP